jgi:uncharacterized protein (DUF2267 family)
MTNEKFGETFKGAEKFTRLWYDLAASMANAGMSTAGEDPPEVAKQMRSAFLKAMSDYCDEYMRSPEFLEGMREAMDRSIELRRELNEFMGRLHHEFQGTSRQDVDHIMQAIRHVETRMLDSIARIDSRFDDLEAKVNGDRPSPVAKQTPKKTGGTRQRKPSAKKPGSARAAGKKAVRKKTQRKR